MSPTLEDVRDHLERAQIALDGLIAAGASAPVVSVEAAQPLAEAPRRGLSDPGAFFNSLRVAKVLGDTLEQGEVDGCTAVLKACEGWPVSWAAYALATPVIETKGTMQPVREAYWLSPAAQEAWARKMYGIEGSRPDKARELGNINPGDGFRFAGRGYVQITGRRNYLAAETALGIPLTTDPDLALEPGNAAKIMRWGMEGGKFTGKALSAYLPEIATSAQFREARRVINGQDRAEEIADIAIHCQAALQAGGWA